MGIELDNSLLVGHAVIDQDHRDLVPLVNVFLASIKSGASKHNICDDIDEISVRFSAHFERENQIMIETSYPDIQSHLAEHRALLGDLRKFLHTIEESSGDQIVATTKAIEDWFLKHIANSDKRLGQFLIERATKSGR